MGIVTGPLLLNLDTALIPSPWKWWPNKLAESCSVMRRKRKRLRSTGNKMQNQSLQQPGPRVTVFVMSYNEARQIREVMETIKWADEIVLLDSFSTDGTVEIAREYGAKIVSEKFCGFGRLRNLALAASSNDWMVSIDSDERCTPAFAAEVRSLVKTPAHDAYFVPRLNYFLDRPIKYCGMYPDYRQPQFFNRKKFRYRED